MKDLSLHILDLVQNSIAAGAARIAVTISADFQKEGLRISIEDNGAGMDRQLLEKASDPFTTTRTTRRVGMGIPLMRASAERAGGWLGIASEKGRGTRVDACFGIGNIDRPPLGDVAGTMAGLAAAEPSREFSLVLESRKGVFRFDTSEVKERLDGVPITEYAVMGWIKEFLNEGIKVIFGGVLDEVDS